MGDPKKQRKKYTTPKFPWDSGILESELKLLGEYGLRNKRELWRAKTLLSNLRGIARSLLGMPEEKRKVPEEQLLGRLRRLGILPETAVLDDVLDLSIENILERRLQTITFRKGYARTINEARQLIIHGHIALDKRRVSSPGYLIPKEEDPKIDYNPYSPLSKPDHPMREGATGAGPETKASLGREEDEQEIR